MENSLFSYDSAHPQDVTVDFASGPLFSSPAHAKPESRGGRERLTLFSKATIGFFCLTFFRRGGKDITRI